jgi:hypothetical protein
MKNSKLFCSLLTTSLLIAVPLSAVHIEVERVDDTGLPWGYIDVSDFGVDENPNILARQNSLIWDHDRSINVSEPPFVDYMIGAFPGTPGVIAEKATGAFLDASQSTIAELGGGGGGAAVPEPEERSSPDRYSSGEMPIGSEKFSGFWTWTDGAPLPAATSWYGSCWSSWGPEEIFEMEVRVDLASEEQVNVAHLFNDGWYYSSDLGNYAGEGTPHLTLDGHELSVIHYSASGEVIDEQLVVLPSGGGSNVPGVANEYAATLGVAPSNSSVRPDGKYYLIDNWKQFYTAKFRATRQAEGDYLMIRHRAANIGYRATLVTLGDDRPWDHETGRLVVNDWSRLDFSWVYGLTEEWGVSTYMGYVYVPFLPYLYQVDLGWLYYSSSNGDNHYFYSFDLGSYILINEAFGGFYYIYATDDYTNQIPQP